MDQLPHLSIVDASGEQVMTSPAEQAFLAVLMGGIEETPVGSLRSEVQALVHELAGTARATGPGAFTNGVTYVQRSLQNLLEVCSPELDGIDVD